MSSGLLKIFCLFNRLLPGCQGLIWPQGVISVFTARILPFLILCLKMHDHHFLLPHFRSRWSPSAHSSKLTRSPPLTFNWWKFRCLLSRTLSLSTYPRSPTLLPRHLSRFLPRPHHAARRSTRPSYIIVAPIYSLMFSLSLTAFVYYYFHSISDCVQLRTLDTVSPHSIVFFLLHIQ
jgi:hypothetical protein